MPERKIVYESLAQKADSGFIIRAPSLERLYVDAGLAFTDRIARLDTLQTTHTQRVTVVAPNREALMAQWLNEILHLFKTQKFLAKRIVFSGFDGKKINATLTGDHYEPVRHGVAPEMQPVEPEQVKLEDALAGEPQFTARIIVDKR